jgi:hypothetical protein
MIINGQYINLTEINSIVPIGNMDKCRVTFNSGRTETFNGYKKIIGQINQGDSK